MFRGSYDRCDLESHMAVGTGFGQVFRGIGMMIWPRSTLYWIPSENRAGQVGGVAVSSALFQSILDRELRKRIHRPDAEHVRSLSFSLVLGSRSASG